MIFKKRFWYWIPVLLFNCGSIASTAQTLQRCATWEYFQLQQQINPSASEKWKECESAAENWQMENHAAPRSDFVVPVVVHVIYKTPSQNISDQQILSQMDVLNEDFNALNADFNKVPDVWKNVASGVSVHFCLAAYDPQGNPTSGIERIQTTHSIFGLGDSVKHASTGGADAWPSKDYLNIWVCNLGSGVLGYTTLPGTARQDEDGVVVLYNAFGRTGTLKTHYDLGRTCTHEVGHWLGLVHPWGDDGGVCSGTDNIDDTPNEGGPVYGCNTFPLYDNCTSGGNGVMFMDYMDYSDDACMYMFTADQASKMTAVLNTSRLSVVNSPAGCQGYQYDLDASLDLVVYPTDTVYQQSFQPKVQIADRGIKDITYVQVNYRVDGQPAQSYDCTLALTSGSFDIVTLPIYFTGEGGHQFSAWVANPNHLADEFAYNDSAASAFIVRSSVNKNTLLVYPNPSNGDITIVISNPSAAFVHWQIISELGQVMRSGTSSSMDQSAWQFHLQNLPSGVYFFYATLGYDHLKKELLFIQNP